MIKKCKLCGKDFESDLNLNQYCTTKCRSRDKFVEIQKGGNSFKVWKKNYDKYPEFYDSLSSYRDKYKNKCFVCEKEYERFSMCCSKECSLIMKKHSTFLTTGANHNLSNNSIARKNMTESLQKKYGVDNVFARRDVLSKLKDTWIKKYGYTNPSKCDYIKNKKRSTAEKNGFWTPKENFHGYSRSNLSSDICVHPQRIANLILAVFAPQHFVCLELFHVNPYYLISK